jgi:hypothetical protein
MQMPCVSLEVKHSLLLNVRHPSAEYLLDSAFPPSFSNIAQRLSTLPTGRAGDANLKPKMLSLFPPMKMECVSIAPPLPPFVQKTCYYSHTHNARQHSLPSRSQLPRDGALGHFCAWSELTFRLAGCLKFRQVLLLLTNRG